MTRKLILSAAAALSLAALQGQTPATPSLVLSRAVGPFLTKTCQGCHSTALPSGSVNMQQLLASPTSLVDSRETWEGMAYQIQSGRMPPDGAAKPTKADSDAALELISRALAANPRATGSPITQAPTGASTADWLTFSYDGERTGWNRGETRISKATAPQLQLLWRLQTDTVPNPINRYSTLTDPIVVNNVPTREGPKKVVYVGSRDNSMYAIDAEKGTVIWKRAYPNTATPPIADSGNCPNNMNATPVVDKQSGIIYFLPNDGKLRGVSLSDGEDRFPATAMVPAYSRNFSLNLVEGRIFTGTTRGCANTISRVAAINVADPAHEVTTFYTSTGKASGPWGRGGIVKTPFGMLAQTADGAYDPASGRWGSSVIGFTKDGRLTDSYTPIDQVELDARDFDLGSSSPVVFDYGGRSLVATSAKEGKIYLLDAKNLGGLDHRTPLYVSPRFSNDAMLFGYNGMWSVLSTHLDAQGKRWILAPFYGPAAKDSIALFPKTHGQTVNGVLMAFTVEGPADKPTLKPQWMSGDMDLPGVAVIANGVILTLANGDRGATLIPGAARGGGRAAAADNENPSPAGGGGGRGGAGAAPAAAGGRAGAAPAAAGGRGGGGGGGRGGLPPGVQSVMQPNPNEAGFERDAEWMRSQRVPFEEGGQKGGQRFSGGRDTTNAVLYALDPQTGDELYSSGNAIDSWNHYGGIALSDGVVYVSTWDARVYAIGLKK